MLKLANVADGRDFKNIVTFVDRSQSDQQALETLERSLSVGEVVVLRGFKDAPGCNLVLEEFALQGYAATDNIQVHGMCSFHWGPKTLT